MSSYLRRGFIGAVLCLVLALAYQYMIAGRAPLSKAARIATSVPSPKVANMPRAPVIALSHGGGMDAPHAPPSTSTLTSHGIYPTSGPGE